MKARDIEFEVNSEIGALKRVLIHAPDDGIGKVVPQKAQDWLYEDIVHLPAMRAEFDVYKQVLLAILDPASLASWFKAEGSNDGSSHAMPGHDNYIASRYIVDIEELLAESLRHVRPKETLVASVCAIEGRASRIKHQLLALEPRELAHVLLTGVLGEGNERGQYVFPPIPNYIFTRDLGAVLGHRLLLGRPAKRARAREAVLTNFVAHQVLSSGDPDRLIELSEDEEYYLRDEEERQRYRITIEGGDLMMISESHLLIGCSERTSLNSIHRLANRLMFMDGGNVDRISVINLPKGRTMMHLDTVLTQVRRDLWLLYPGLSPRATSEARRFHRSTSTLHRQPAPEIIHYQRKGSEVVEKPYESIEALLAMITREEFRVDEPRFIYCGDNEYPYTEREQWTDACNVLALREGLVIGYDRNERTADAFERQHFRVVLAQELIANLRNVWFEDKSSSNLRKVVDEELAGDTLVLLPSAELSRARGGSHCMSLPLERAPLEG